jgi:multiple sugar transport system permease protein
MCGRRPHCQPHSFPDDVDDWGSLRAACAIRSLPLAVLCNFFLDRSIASFAVGAVK